MQTTAIVVAAGEGRRMGGEISKSYLPIAGRPMVLRTVERMFEAKSVGQVIVVVAAAERDRCEALVREDLSLRGRSCRLQIGGRTRQQSVQKGLQMIDPETEIIIIHDGARPFVSAALIDRCVECAAEKGAVVVGVPARDTIKFVDPAGQVQATPDRSSLWEVQTPQVFQKDLIVAAHASAERDGVEVTDDAALVERMSKPVHVLEGERTNFKITLPEDIWLAELMIREGRVPQRA